MYVLPSVTLSPPVIRVNSTERNELENSSEDELGQLAEREGLEERKREEEQGGERRDEEVEDDLMEWELRNTDSVFSELSDLSRDYVASVDQGATVRGKRTQKNLRKEVFH